MGRKPFKVKGQMGRKAVKIKGLPSGLGLVKPGLDGYPNVLEGYPPGWTWGYKMRPNGRRYKVFKLIGVPGECQSLPQVHARIASNEMDAASTPPAAKSALNPPAINRAASPPAVLDAAVAPSSPSFASLLASLSPLSAIPSMPSHVPMRSPPLQVGLLESQACTPSTTLTPYLIPNPVPDLSPHP